MWGEGGGMATCGEKGEGWPHEGRRGRDGRMRGEGGGMATCGEKGEDGHMWREGGGWPHV